MAPSGAGSFWRVEHGSAFQRPRRSALAPVDAPGAPAPTLEPGAPYGRPSRRAPAGVRTDELRPFDSLHDVEPSSGGVPQRLRRSMAVLPLARDPACAIVHSRCVSGAAGSAPAVYWTGGRAASPHALGAPTRADMPAHWHVHEAAERIGAPSPPPPLARDLAAVPGMSPHAPRPACLSWADVARCAHAEGGCAAPGAQPAQVAVPASGADAASAQRAARGAGGTPACAGRCGGARGTPDATACSASLYGVFETIVDVPSGAAKASSATAFTLGPRPERGWMPAERPTTAKVEEGKRRAQRSNEPDDELSVAKALWPHVGATRRAGLVLLTSRAFQNCVLAAIVASSVALAFDSPYAWWALRFPRRLAAIQSTALAAVFASIFTLELLLRIVAYGRSFLIAQLDNGVRTVWRPLYWNWVDLAVVVFAWADVALSVRPIGGATSTGWLLSLRLLRVARPLRSLTILPECKTIVETVLSSLSALSDAFKLLAWVMAFFAVLGSQLFRGDLRHVCVGVDGAVADVEGTCTASDELLATFVTPCGVGERCLPVGEPPLSGALSYDHVAVAMVSVFHAIAGSGFSDSMFPLLASNGTPLVLVYYAAMVIFGSLFIVNIFVSVLEQSYDMEVEAKRKEDEDQAQAVEGEGAANEARGGEGAEAVAIAQATAAETEPEFQRPMCAHGALAHCSLPAAPNNAIAAQPVPRSLGTAAARAPAQRARALSVSSRHRSLGSSSGACKVTVDQLVNNAVDAFFASFWRRITCRSQGGARVAPSAAAASLASAPARGLPSALRWASGASGDADGARQAGLSDSNAPPRDADAAEPPAGAFARTRAAARQVVSHWMFELTVVLAIIGSCLVAAISVDPFLDPSVGRQLEHMDIALTAVFVAEVVLRVLGWRWVRYWADRFHRFDFLLVISAVLENAATPVAARMSADAGVGAEAARGLSTGLLILSCFKAFRAVRLVRVAYELEIHSVKELGKRFPKVIASLFAILIVLTIVIFGYAVVMMSAFGGLFAGPDGLPTERQHYDDIGWSMVSVAQITLTADGYFDAHEALNDEPFSSPTVQRALNVGCFLMFTFVILTGTLILLTLVTAVLVSSFNPNEDDASADGVDGATATDGASTRTAPADAEPVRPGTAGKPPLAKTLQELRRGWSRVDHLRCALNRLMPHRFKPVSIDDVQAQAREARHEADFKEMLERASEYGMNDWDVLEAEADFRLADTNDDRRLTVEEAKAIFAQIGFDTHKRDVALLLERYVAEVDDEGDRMLEFGEFVQLLRLLRSKSAAQLADGRGNLSAGAGARSRPRASKIKLTKPRFVRQQRRPPVPTGASRVYRAIYWAIHHPAYEFANTLLIATSIILLALELSTVDGERDASLRQGSAVITACFVLDVLMTMYVKGVLEYFITPAHALDTLVVCATIISLALPNVPGLEALRALRVLRIFQLLSEFREMRLLIESLSASIQGTCTVFFFLGLFVFLFAILGVAIFGGAFARCVDAEAQLMYSQALRLCGRGECEAVCASEGGEWLRPLPNFDSTAEGVWALFVITTLEEWSEVLYNAVDSRGVLLQPVQRERLGWSWRQDFALVYFFAFIIVNVILMTNLFIGVVCSEFQNAKQKKERLTSLSAEQREWALVHELLTHHAPRRLPRAPRDDAPALQRWCFRIFYHGPSAPPAPDAPSTAGASVATSASASAAAQQRKMSTAKSAVFRPGMLAAAHLDAAQTGARRGRHAAAAAQRTGVLDRTMSAVFSGTMPAADDWDSVDKRTASFYVALIVFTCNVISLACVLLEYHGMGAQYERWLCFVQLGCSALLWVDIAGEIVAVGLSLHLAGSAWDRLELALEIITPTYCACRIGALYGVTSLDHRNLRLLGAARSLRLIRLLTVSWFYQVGAIMHALFLSLPAVANLVVLILCVILAFDFVGVSLFARAVVADAYPDGEGLSDDLNFKQLGNGFVTLCVLMRFEGWSALWADLLVTRYDGHRPPEWAIYAYFVVFLVIAVFMMLSVFVALLLDTLERLNAASGNTIDQRAIRKFCERWSELDPTGDQMIDLEQLGALLRGLGPPFVSRSEVSTMLQLTKLLMHLDLPVYLPENAAGEIRSRLVLPAGAEVTYLEVVYALAKRAVFADAPELYELEPELERMVLSKLPKAFPIVRLLSNQRTFTSELAIARAIARVAFDPLRGIQQAPLDPTADDDSDEGFFSESVQDDRELGLRGAARDGEVRFVAL